jgi:hypothetical protein
MTVLYVFDFGFFDLKNLDEKKARPKSGLKKLFNTLNNWCEQHAQSKTKKAKPKPSHRFINP